MGLLIPQNVEALRKNNFDAIRLAMALLVVWSHSFALFLGSEASEPISVLLNGTYNAGNLGVMAFFVISGFLIALSFVRSRSVTQYMIRRVRRIHPGYIVATTICAFIVVPAYSNMMHLSPGEVVKTFGLNLLLQNHMPPSTVFAATPVPQIVNGSLWSIPYEFWCYIGVAVLGIAGLLTKARFVVATLLTVMIGRVVLDMLGRKPGGGIIGDIIGFPYLWFVILPSFLLGVVFYNYQNRIPRSPVLLAGLVVAAVASARISPHLANLIVAPALAYAIFYLAFSSTVRMHNAAKWGDFSYGTYLYAFPIQQMLVASYGFVLSFAQLTFLAFCFSLLAGVLSWHLVERWFLGKASPAPLAREAQIVAP